jgi:hypothetical protein
MKRKTAPKLKKSVNYCDEIFSFNNFFSQKIDSIFSMKRSKTEYFPLLLSSQFFCKISPRKRKKKRKKKEKKKARVILVLANILTCVVCVI